MSLPVVAWCSWIWNGRFGKSGFSEAWGGALRNGAAVQVKRGWQDVAQLGPLRQAQQVAVWRRAVWLGMVRKSKAGKACLGLVARCWQRSETVQYGVAGRVRIGSDAVERIGMARTGWAGAAKKERGVEACSGV